MALVRDLLTVLLVAAGALFFVAGTVGLLRFPDLYTRLHAMAKADNVGLGLIVGGLLLQAPTWSAAAQLVLVWILVLLSSASGAHLLARSAYRRGKQPWSAP